MNSLTAWAEQALPALRTELEGAAAADELQVFLEEALKQEFTTWSRGR